MKARAGNLTDAKQIALTSVASHILSGGIGDRHTRRNGQVNRLRRDEIVRIPKEFIGQQIGASSIN